MLHATVPVLFESSENLSILHDPVNEDWLALVQAIDGPSFEMLARRYYLALTHFRQQKGRPPLPDQTTIEATGKQQAFLAAPLHGLPDDPGSVFRLLRRNPVFAHWCGFLGPKVLKEPEELTSRRLPARTVCEEFSEVMTRYGLWHLARVEKVIHNLASGVVELEDTVSFDTTHVEAYSHCGNVVPADREVDDGKKPKQRKVPRLKKNCTCGKENWETCIHSWVPTDEGAAVVVKGPTRVYWAHKGSVAAFGRSEIPFDVRICHYAAEHDGNTLVPHLKLLNRDLALVMAVLAYVLADDAYQGNKEKVRQFGLKARLIRPVHPRKVRATLARQFDGIDHFTALGIPVCEADHRFELRGRDISGERYIWVAPDDEAGHPVCQGCPHAGTCLSKGKRRNIRVHRNDLPQLDWDHPQLSARERKRYQQRTGVERAIKRLKVDLKGEILSHRDARRVQAHFDRKLLTLHLLLAIAHPT